MVYLRRFNFDQGREASILSGTNLIPLYNQLGSQNLLNYTQNSKGASVSASYPLRRSFARLGITYGYDISNVVTQTTAAQTYFQYINFSGVSGPNSLNGIKTSHIVPSYTYNTVNHPITPTGGRSVFFSLDFAGSVLDIAGDTQTTVGKNRQHRHGASKIVGHQQKASGRMDAHIRGTGPAGANGVEQL